MGSGCVWKYHADSQSPPDDHDEKEPGVVNNTRVRTDPLPQMKTMVKKSKLSSFLHQS